MPILTRRLIARLAASALLVIAGCNENQGPDEGEGSEKSPQDASNFEFDENGFVKRPRMTRAECEARQGWVVPDDGGGNTAEAEYRCQDGRIPVATVPDAGIEGGVCCLL